MKQSSDQNILQSIKKKNKFPHIISFPKAEDDYFMFHHTPAEVIYHVDGFKVKNSDKIQDNLKQMIKNSKNPFIQTILSNEVISNKQQQVDKQIVEKFSKQIGELNKQLRECNVQFVRCIKVTFSPFPSDPSRILRHPPVPHLDCSCFSSPLQGQ